jgi:hypothetical protein
MLWILAGRQPHGLYKHLEFFYTPTWTRYPSVNDFHSYVRRSNVHTKIDGTELDFVFASGERGIQRCVVPLALQVDSKASYKIRLGFCGLPEDRVGQRVFDIRINGKQVEEQFDALKAAGGPDRAIWREYEVAGASEAVLEFIAADPNPSLETVPLLSAMEIIRLAP